MTLAIMNVNDIGMHTNDEIIEKSDSYQLQDVLGNHKNISGEQVPADDLWEALFSAYEYKSSIAN